MDSLEERIVGSMVRMLEAEPGGERGMFVLSTGSMATSALPLFENLAGVRILKDGPVALVCRDAGA